MVVHGVLAGLPTAHPRTNRHGIQHGTVFWKVQSWLVSIWWVETSDLTVPEAWDRNLRLRGELQVSSNCGTSCHAMSVWFRIPSCQDMPNEIIQYVLRTCTFSTKPPKSAYHLTIVSLLLPFFLCSPYIPPIEPQYNS